MNTRMYVINATVRKELRTLRRNKRKLFIVTLLPLLYYSSFFILMGGIYSSGISVALVVEENSPGYYTNGLIEILEEHDSIPPNLMIIKTDAETADSLFANGDVLVVIVIPEGFENSVANGSSAHIQVRVNNIHEDATKICGCQSSVRWTCSIKNIWATMHLLTLLYRLHRRFLCQGSHTCLGQLPFSLLCL
ncbi:MAG: ABC transporter permease [Candidatus Thorarchaeota archaeon]